MYKIGYDYIPSNMANKGQFETGFRYIKSFKRSTVEVPVMSTIGPQKTKIQVTEIVDGVEIPVTEEKSFFPELSTTQDSDDAYDFTGEEDIADQIMSHQANLNWKTYGLKIKTLELIKKEV